MTTYTEDSAKRTTEHSREAPELLAGYMNRIGQGQLLTQRQELALARKARAGDKKARQKLVEKNLRLAVSVARSPRSIEGWDFRSKTSYRKVT